jgi:predicted PurR-regulated permease PerM
MRIRRVTRERPDGAGHNGDPVAEFEVDIKPGELTGAFAPPPWLRDLGGMSWLLVGVALMLVGAVWLLSLTSTIVVPVVTASIIAAVLSPAVSFLERHRLPRIAATAIVFLTVIVAAGLMIWLVVGGITSQAGALEDALKKGADKLQSTVQDLGVSSGKAQQANTDASADLSSGFHALIDGVGRGLKALGSLAIFLSFTLLSLFLLLADGPRIRRWLEGHMGVPPAVGRTIGERTIQSLRGYFTGVTIVAAFNAVVIGVAALVLGVPRAGSIAAVNFVAAYIPYLGAWSAGAFTVLLAYGDQGASTAAIMIVVVLLANGALQQMIQPLAFGAALGIHPLAVLIVTIAGGALFGTIGLVLAAPLTSAATHISADLARARAKEQAVAAEANAPPPQPQPT